MQQDQKIFDCNGAGGFGIFFDKKNLITLLTDLKAIKIKGSDKIQGSETVVEYVNKYVVEYEEHNKNVGFKLLQTREHYDDEVNGLTKAKQFMNITYFDTKKPGFVINSSNDNTKLNFVVKYDMNGIKCKQGVCSSSLYFVMMEVLQPFNKIETQSSIEYNRYCLTNIINPLLEQLDKLHHNKTDPYYHQDIKPANIMFTSDGKATLIDFGLMKSEKECTSSCGTPLYMSPAYWQGRHGFNEANFLDADQNCMKIGSLSYNNFYKWRSFKSYIDNFKSLKTKYENKNTFRRYLLMKNDQYCLGQAIQEMCGACIPKVDDCSGFKMFNPVCKVSNRLHEEALKSVPFTAVGGNYITLPFNKGELEKLTNMSSNQQRGGSHKKTFRVFGKERNVFKKNGYGNKFFVRIKNKDVPLKDALGFEKNIKYLL